MNSWCAAHTVPMSTAQQAVREFQSACKALAAREGDIPAIDIADISKSALAVTASVEACMAYCNTIRWISRRSDKTCAACGGGAVKAVLAIAEANWALADVQEAACHALVNLAANAGNARVITAGGLRVVYAAMEVHKHSEGVQALACALLANLAVDSTTSARIALSGGLEQIYTAMKEHGTSVVVQEKACAALRNLARQPDIMSDIVASGGLERVYAAMEVQPTTQSLQWAAYGALRNLAVNVDLKRKIRGSRRAVDLLQQASAACSIVGVTQSQSCVIRADSVFSDASTRGVHSIRFFLCCIPLILLYIPFVWSGNC